MAWSIFDLPNGEAVATAWAVALLQALNLEATPDRIRFVFDWEKSEGGGGAYNPLNQGPVPNNPGLTSTGPQYGGGAADFVNWQAGIQGAVDYLNMPNFQPVLAAMQQGNYGAMASTLWNSPWAGGHYGYGSAWNTQGYVQMSPDQINAAATAVGFDTNAVLSPNSGIGGGGGVTPTTGTGGTINSAPGNTLNGTPLTMADIPAVIAWIKQNWGSYAWLLDNPEVANVLEQAAVQGLAADQVQARIVQTNWWKTTSTAMRQYEQDFATNPADYNFGTPGSKASQMLAQIRAEAGTLGVELNGGQLQNLATEALRFGWTSQQIQQNIGAAASYNGFGQTNAPSVTEQLSAMANQYFQRLSAPVMQWWAGQIAGGSRTMADFQGTMAKQAAMKWTGFGQQLLAGDTMAQLTDNLRQEAGKTMEIDPSSINFTTDPTYMKIIDYAPPPVPGASQLPQHRVMTLSEMDQYLKGLPQWGTTQQARDHVSQLSDQILQDFGKAPATGI